MVFGSLLALGFTGYHYSHWDGLLGFTGFVLILLVLYLRVKNKPLNATMKSTPYSGETDILGMDKPPGTHEPSEQASLNQLLNWRLVLLVLLMITGLLMVRLSTPQAIPNYWPPSSYYWGNYQQLDEARPDP